MTIPTVEAGPLRCRLQFLNSQFATFVIPLFRCISQSSNEQRSYSERSKHTFSFLNVLSLYLFISTHLTILFPGYTLLFQKTLFLPRLINMGVGTPTKVQLVIRLFERFSAYIPIGLGNSSSMFLTRSGTSSSTFLGLRRSRRLTSRYSADSWL